MTSHVSLPTSLNDVPLPVELPPLVLVAFTRPDLLKKVLAAVRQQSLMPSKIIGFIDGARKADDEPLIEQCISLLEELSTLVPVHIVKRNHNLGCDQNVILGLTEVLSSHDSLIYLEDDIVPNPHFYDRMCRLLEAYRHHQQICSISAYASLPAELSPRTDTDFIVSNRVFSWGFATWADRWKELNLANQSEQYNPFGEFYKIPATSQTKRTMINQFWLEKNRQTDWVITFTLAALYHQKTHLVPTTSFTTNIGFGHPEAKTYKGKELAWVNARYDANFCPKRLPVSLELPEELRHTLNNTSLTQHLLKQGELWLNPSAFLYLARQSKNLSNVLALLKLFVIRLPLMLKRWRRGLPV
ncbi:sugar transferase [Leptolyngbya sp. FACHB-671]|uniref:sugar transferase n=1 Tax=Leptolyngbya sp. FACHB-671 TaxID=2692812 RepID=UPI001689D48A|nr:sugar transferase [Leptolyngbya sp. FACHB-671]